MSHLHSQLLRSQWGNKGIIPANPIICLRARGDAEMMPESLPPLGSVFLWRCFPSSPAGSLAHYAGTCWNILHSKRPLYPSAKSNLPTPALEKEQTIQFLGQRCNPPHLKIPSSECICVMKMSCICIDLLNCYNLVQLKSLCSSRAYTGLAKALGGEEQWLCLLCCHQMFKANLQNL